MKNYKIVNYKRFAVACIVIIAIIISFIMLAIEIFNPYVEIEGTISEIHGLEVWFTAENGNIYSFYQETANDYHLFDNCIATFKVVDYNNFIDMQLVDCQVIW